LPHISNLLAPFTAVLLAIAPIGNLALAMVLVVVADIAIALFIARLIAARRKKTVGSVVVMDAEMPMELRRRTEPGLRARRPTGIVEMQVRWRQAAEAHRRAQTQKTV